MSRNTTNVAGPIEIHVSVSLKSPSSGRPELLRRARKKKTATTCDIQPDIRDSAGFPDWVHYHTETVVGYCATTYSIS